MHCRAVHSAASVDSFTCASPSASRAILLDWRAHSTLTASGPMPPSQTRPLVLPAISREHAQQQAIYNFHQGDGSAALTIALSAILSGAGLFSNPIIPNQCLQGFALDCAVLQPLLRRARSPVEY